jgi:ribosome-associated translation inhibitor RaiA
MRTRARNWPKIASHFQVMSVRFGPKGGADRRCKIQRVLPRIPDIVVEDTQASLYVAIDRAVNRAGRTLRRHLMRRRDQCPARQLVRLAATDEYARRELIPACVTGAAAEFAVSDPRPNCSPSGLR